MQTGKSNGQDVQKDTITQEVQNADKKENRPQTQAAQGGQGKRQDLTAFLKENAAAVIESKRQAEAAEKAAMDVETHDPLEKIVTDEQEQQAALDKLMGITSPIAKAAAQQKAIMDKITGASSPIAKATAQNIDPIFAAIQANQLERTIPSLKEQYARLESSPITKAMQDAMVQLEKLAQSPMLLEAMKWANEANNMMNIMGAAMTEMYSSVADVVEAFSKTPNLVKLIEQISAFRPFLEAELEAKRQENPDAYKDITIDDVIRHKTPELQKLWIEILPGAQKRQQKAEEKEKAAALPCVTGRPPEILPWALDKLNQNWSSLPADAVFPDGYYHLKTGENAKKETAELLFKINWDEIERSGDVTIPKVLTPFDKRVHTAVMGILQAQGQIMSAGQIYTAMGMGKKKSPNAKDKKKILDSLVKMNAAQIVISTEKERDVNKSYPAFEYKGSLLPSAQLTAIINGARTETAIKILDTPPLLAFAQSRHQITVIPRKLLESPLSMTDDNITLADYFITRISRMKANPKTSRKMLFKTIFSNCGIETGSQRTRAHGKIEKLLDHYCKEKWIIGYTKGAEGIIIRLPDKEKK